MKEALSSIKPEQWVMLAGAALFIGISLVALIPNDIDVDVATARSGPAQNKAHLHRQVAANEPRGRAPVNAPAGQQNGGVAVTPLQMQTVAVMKPMKVAATEHYQGRVTQVINRDPGGWGQIHVMVQRGGRNQEVSLAPKWYLTFQGCNLSSGQQVSGEAFRFDKVRPNAPVYARHVTINGVRCRLRTLDGLALWSDQPQ